MSVHDVIVQEGVQTSERMHDAVASFVVYTMDRYVVGGFYRMHPERGIDENLNAPGSSYVPLAFLPHSAQMPQAGQHPGASAPNRFYMYGVIGRRNTCWRPATSWRLPTQMPRCTTKSKNQPESTATEPVCQP